MTAGTSQTSDAVLARLSRLHPKRIDLSLSRMHRLLAALGNPERQLPPVVHVAGTNGKGSTIAFLRAMLEAGGYRVHAYTSPHLVRFHERIRLAHPGGAGSAPVTEAELLSLLDVCERANNGTAITYFEIVTAAAFLGFAKHPADILLLEVGLGGRLDSTNVVDVPALTVITPVSMDHMEHLGDTLAKIASEKAGILKPGAPCVVAPQHPDALGPIERRAREIGAPLAVAGNDWQAGGNRDEAVFVHGAERQALNDLGLMGEHQIVNAGTALACLRRLPDFAMPRRTQAQGLRSATWAGRLQRLRHGPLAERLPDEWELWLDGGHNASAGAALAAVAQDWAQAALERALFLICGMLNTKQAEAFLEPLAGHATRLVAVPIPDTPASLAPTDLVAHAATVGHDTMPGLDVATALDLILQEFSGGKPARVLICGSLYLAGAVLRENG